MGEVLDLPKLMNSLPMFSRTNCRFRLTREKCARVVVYRRLGILRSYTLETTFNGCDQGNLTNLQITESDLCELGVGLLSSISMLKEQILHTRPIMSHFHSTRTLTNPNVDNHNAAIFITDIFICELIYIFVII